MIHKNHLLIQNIKDKNKKMVTILGETKLIFRCADPLPLPSSPRMIFSQVKKISQLKNLLKLRLTYFLIFHEWRNKQDIYFLGLQSSISDFVVF